MAPVNTMLGGAAGSGGACGRKWSVSTPFGISSTTACGTRVEHPGTLGLGDADDAVEGPDRLLLPEAVEHAVPGRGEAPIGPEAEVDLAPKAQRFHVVHRKHCLRTAAGIDGADVRSGVGKLDLNDVVVARATSAAVAARRAAHHDRSSGPPACGRAGPWPAGARPAKRAVIARWSRRARRSPEGDRHRPPLRRLSPWPEGSPDGVSKGNAASLESGCCRRQMAAMDTRARRRGSSSRREERRVLTRPRGSNLDA